MQVINHIEYNPNTGELFVLKNSKPYRKIYANEDDTVIISINKTQIKMKYDRLVWCIFHKVLLKPTEVVFHKDLDQNNNRINNLCIISKSLHAQILEAMKNLSGTLRLIPHQTDAFCYVLEYKDKGRLKREVISDIVIARKKLLKMQIRYIKFVSQYVLTE